MAREIYWPSPKTDKTGASGDPILGYETNPFHPLSISGRPVRAGTIRRRLYRTLLRRDYDHQAHSGFHYQRYFGRKGLIGFSNRRIIRLFLRTFSRSRFHRDCVSEQKRKFVFSVFGFFRKHRRRLPFPERQRYYDAFEAAGHQRLSLRSSLHSNHAKSRKRCNQSAMNVV